MENGKGGGGTSYVISSARRNVVSRIVGEMRSPVLFSASNNGFA